MLIPLRKLLWIAWLAGANILDYGFFILFFVMDGV